MNTEKHPEQIHIDEAKLQAWIDEHVHFDNDTWGEILAAQMMTGAAWIKTMPDGTVQAESNNDIWAHAALPVYTHTGRLKRLPAALRQVWHLQHLEVVA